MLRWHTAENNCLELSDWHMSNSSLVEYYEESPKSSWKMNTKKNCIHFKKFYTPELAYRVFSFSTNL